MGGRVNWRQFRALIAAGAVGALIVSVAPAAADIGEALILGQGNTADASTHLTGDTAKNLVITNTNADGVALALEVERGNAPMSVNSAKKVKKLNADRLDGKSSQAFLLKSQAPRAAFVAKQDLPDGNDDRPTTLLTVKIDAPAAGVLQINAAADSSVRYWDSWSSFSCWVSVDGAKVRGSEYFSMVAAGVENDFTQANNWGENCVSVAATNVEEGTHTVRFRTNAWSTWTVFDNGTLNALWVPFDGTGAVPLELVDVNAPDEASKPAMEPLSTEQ